MLFDRVLRNQCTDAQRDCVLINAAFAIRVIEPERSVESCLAIARESLESGKTLATFKKFVALNS